MTPVGVLVLSYGTPSAPEELEAYYTHIRRGRPPTPEQLADLRRRYDAIGGVSPLAARTAAQTDGVARALRSLSPDGFVVTAAAKHAPPFIEDGVAALAAAGARRAVALVLAPHYSALSVGEYLERASEAATAAGVELGWVSSWHTHPRLVELLAGRVEEALAGLGRHGGDCEVVFSAHSLPTRVEAMGDPYPRQLRETAEAVATRCRLPRWRTAWQSAGRTPEPWLGPDILEVIREMTGAVVVCPAGFTADHLEVLYDLDVEAAAVAHRAGVEFARTRSLNDDAELCELLAGMVAEVASGRAAGPGWSGRVPR